MKVRLFPGHTSRSSGIIHFEINTADALRVPMRLFRWNRKWSPPLSGSVIDTANALLVRGAAR